VTTIDLKAAGAFFGELDGRRKRQAIVGCKLAAARCVQTIQTVIIPARTPQPVDRGIYRAGWKIEPLDNGAAFYNDSPVAAIIEHGVRASNIKIGRKLLAALAAWVIRKGLVLRMKNDAHGTATQNAAMSMAWAIAKKAAAGKGFHNRFSGGGQQIMSDCNLRYTGEYVVAEVTRAIGTPP
jgi:hypothetical protein